MGFNSGFKGLTLLDHGAMLPEVDPTVLAGTHL